MVNYCTAYGCKNKAKKGLNISFHIFPMDSSLSKKWVIAMKRDKFKPTMHSRLCSGHFNKDDFERNFGQKTLKKNVIPSVFNFSQHLQKISKPRPIRRKANDTSSFTLPDSSSSANAILAEELPIEENMDDVEPAASTSSATNDDFKDETENLQQAKAESSDDDDAACMFCLKKRKKLKGREQELHVMISSGAMDNLESKAVALDDVEMLAIIQRKRAGKIILYHSVCKKNFENRMKKQAASERDPTDWHVSRIIHKKAFEEVCRFVNENIVKNEQSVCLSFLHSLFVDYLSEHLNHEITNIKPYHLESRLLTTFKKKINIIEIDAIKIVKPMNNLVWLKKQQEEAQEVYHDVQQQETSGHSFNIKEEITIDESVLEDYLIPKLETFESSDTTNEVDPHSLSYMGIQTSQETVTRCTPEKTTVVSPNIGNKSHNKNENANFANIIPKLETFDNTSDDILRVEENVSFPRVQNQPVQETRILRSTLKDNTNFSSNSSNTSQTKKRKCSDQDSREEDHDFPNIVQVKSENRENYVDYAMYIAARLINCNQSDNAITIAKEKIELILCDLDKGVFENLNGVPFLCNS